MRKLILIIALLPLTALAPPLPTNNRPLGVDANGNVSPNVNVKFGAGKLWSNGSTVDSQLAAKQPLDADLTAVAALATDSFGLQLLTKTTAAAIRSYIGAGTSSFDGDAANLTGTLSDARLSANVPLKNATNAFTAVQSIDGGTVTANDPILTLSQTWNNSGVTFQGLKLNVTNTASLPDSKLLDLQVGGVSKFTVLKSGYVVAPLSVLATGNVYGLTFTSGTNLTQDKQVLYMDTSWANSGVNFKAIYLNVNDFDSQSNSAFLDFQIAGVSKFTIRKDGAITAGSIAESLVTFTDITTNNVSTTKHGYAPKAPNDATKYLDGTGAYSVPSAAAQIGVIGIVIDGAGSAITTGSKGYVYIPYSATVNDWTILAKESGSIVIDVKKSTYSGFPTTSTIAGSEKPTLSSAQKNQDTSLTSFSTSVTAGDVWEFNVDSASTVTRCVVEFKVTK